MDERSQEQKPSRYPGKLAGPGDNFAGEPGKNGDEGARPVREVRYRDLIDQSPFSIIIYAPDGRPIYANPASFALWKIAPESWAHLKDELNILDDPLMEKYGLKPYLEAGFAGEPTELPPVNFDLQAAFDGTGVEPVTEKFWVSGYVYPLKDAQGEITEVVVVHEDITRQKNAEEELRQSEERFRELAENINEVFWLFDWVEQRVIYVSPAYETVWGRSVEPLYERYEVWAESIHPEDVAAANESFQQIAATGGGEVREYRILRPNGEIRWISDRGFAIADETGRVVRIAGIAEDITGRWEVLQKLNRRLAFEEAIAEISSGFVGVTDMDVAIQNALEKIGVLSQVSRTYLFQFRDDGLMMDNTQEWCETGVCPEIENLQNIWLADFPWVIPKIKKGEVVAIDDIGELPGAASALRESLEGQHIKSCLLMPVWIAGQIGGYVGLDNLKESKAWHSEDIALLRVTSNIIGSALTREQYELAEQEARRQSEVLRQAMMSFAANLDLEQVLEKLLIYLEQVIPYDSASVILLENRQLKIEAARGLPEGESILGRVFSAENALFQEMCEKGKPVVLQDAQKEGRFEDWGASRYIHAWMGIPVTGRKGILGYMTVDSKQPGVYAGAEARLAETFAAQAAIAIENARLYAELQVVATSDPLTGLHNRRHFFDLAAQELSRARRHNRPLSAIMLDIDQFKRVNDTYGHAVGDSVLVEAAAVMGAEIRNNDVIARYGGEEFVILLPETDLTVAHEVAERIRSKIGQTDFISGNGPVHITASLGVATLQPEWYSIDPLLQFADSALYMAKAKGRNRVELWGAH